MPLINPPFGPELAGIPFFLFGCPQVVFLPHGCRFDSHGGYIVIVLLCLLYACTRYAWYSRGKELPSPETLFDTKTKKNIFSFQCFICLTQYFFQCVFTSNNYFFTNYFHHIDLFFDIITFLRKHFEFFWLNLIKYLNSSFETIYKLKLILISDHYSNSISHRNYHRTKTYTATITHEHIISPEYQRTGYCPSIFFLTFQFQTIFWNCLQHNYN